MLAHLHECISLSGNLKKKVFFILFYSRQEAKKILYAHSKIKNSEELQLVLHACITISNMKKRKQKNLKKRKENVCLRRLRTLSDGSYL